MNHDSVKLDFTCLKNFGKFQQTRKLLLWHENIFKTSSQLKIKFPFLFNENEIKNSIFTIQKIPKIFDKNKTVQPSLEVQNLYQWKQNIPIFKFNETKSSIFPLWEIQENSKKVKILIFWVEQNRDVKKCSKFPLS